MGHRRSRRDGCLRVFLFRRKLAGFDAAIALAGDAERESSVLQAITDGIGDDRVTDHLGPVRQRQLRREGSSLLFAGKSLTGCD
jgi:hypothetical protein